MKHFQLILNNFVFRFVQFISFEDVSMDGNQSSNPLDYSQNSVVYKEVNGNNTASTSIVTEQNTMNSTPMIPLNQVRDLLNF